MDPVGQTSFIPKQSLSAAAGRGGGGFLVLISVLFLIMSVIGAGGVYGYKSFLNNDIASKDEQLRTVEGAFNASTIQDLTRLDKRIIQSRVLLEKHVSPSSVFYFLSGITLERVQLTSMEFMLLPGGEASITLAGVGDSFQSVALQSDEFGASKMLRDVIFSGITVNDVGKVTFTVNASIDPALISYRASIVGQGATTDGVVPAAPTPAPAEEIPAE